MKETKNLKIRFNGAEINITVSQLKEGFALGASIYGDSKEFPDTTRNIIVNRCMVCGKHQIEEKYETDYICPNCLDKLQSKLAQAPRKKANGDKRAKVKTANTFLRYIAENPTKIKITNLKDYTFKRLREGAINKLFELVLNGYNTEKLIQLKTGLAPVSVNTYMNVLCNAGVLYKSVGSQTYHPSTSVKYIKL